MLRIYLKILLEYIYGLNNYKNSYLTTIHGLDSWHPFS